MASKEKKAFARLQWSNQAYTAEDERSPHPVSARLAKLTVAKYNIDGVPTDVGFATSIGYITLARYIASDKHTQLTFHPADVTKARNILLALGDTAVVERIDEFEARRKKHAA